jgi:hypothetical protein
LIPQPDRDSLRHRTITRRDFHVRDERGQPAMAAVDQGQVGRVYPARSKRLAPDFFFQDQVYRADVKRCGCLRATTVTCGRGPEYFRRRERSDRS